MREAFPSFRAVIESRRVVRVMGAHDALGARLAERAGFDAVWSSSLEVSAARCLPDASLISMSEYLASARAVQRAIGIPVVADCDTGYGGTMNVAYMMHEYEAAGITAVCLEDKQFPKMNSFAGHGQSLLDAAAFADKIAAAKRAQSTPETYVIARTEALIAGGTVAEALERCHRYTDAGADAVLIHSKSAGREQVESFLDRWEGRGPVVIVPTTYPDWHVDEAAAAGVSVVIYANQGLRSTISALRSTFASILELGSTKHLEAQLATVQDVFELQDLDRWRALAEG